MNHPSPVTDFETLAAFYTNASALLSRNRLIQHVESINYTQTMKTGNRPVSDHARATNISLSEKIGGMLHDVLRVTMSRVGGLFDVTAFSEETQAMIAKIGEKRLVYKNDMSVLKNMHDTLHGITHAHKQKKQYTTYRNLFYLRQQLQQALAGADPLVQKTYEEKNDSICTMDEDIATILVPLEKALESHKTIHLKESAKKIDNARVGKSPMPLATWMYYVNVSCDGLQDTTRQPSCLVKKMTACIGETTDIIPNMLNIMREVPALQQSPMIEVLQKSKDNFKNRIVQLDEWRTLQNNADAREALALAGINDQNIYQTAKANALRI